MKKLLTVLAVMLVLVLACTGLAMAVGDDDSKYYGGPFKNATRLHDLLEGHELANPVVLQEPTCTQRAIVQYDCLTHNFVHEVYFDAFGHVWSEWMTRDEDKAPTCTKDGIEYRYCLVCGVDENGEPDWDKANEPDDPTEVDQIVAWGKEKGLQKRLVKALGHVWSSDTGDVNWGKITVEPTCEKDGLAKNFCTRCMKYAEEVAEKERPELLERPIKALGHIYDTYILNYATCLEGEDGLGCAIYHCTRENCDKDGGQYFDADKEKIEKPVSTATGIKVGVINYEAADLKDIKTFPITVFNAKLQDEHGHYWDKWGVQKEADCAVGGIKLRGCFICGQKQRELSDPLEAKWVEASELKDVANKAGERPYEKYEPRLIDCFNREATFVCEHCYLNGTTVHEPYTEITDTVAHKYEVSKDTFKVEDAKANKYKTLVSIQYPTCTQEGIAVFKCLFADEVPGHTDDDLLTIKFADKTAHVWSAWEERMKADPENNNKYPYYLRECLVCHTHQEAYPESFDKLKETDPDVAYELVDSKEPTCEEAGYKKYQSASAGTIEVTINPLGHDWIEEVLIDATCEKAGLKMVSCSREECDQHNPHPEVTDALGHDVVIDEGYDPTFLAEGLSWGWHCTRCDAKEEQFVLPRLTAEPCAEEDHSFVKNEEMTIPATCTEIGKEFYVCEYCGTTKIVDIAKLDHTFDEEVEAKVINAGDCTTDKVVSKVCTMCEQEIFFSTPAPGHVEVAYEEVAPTVEAVGYTGGTYCSVCGKELSPRTEIAKLKDGFLKDDDGVYRLYKAGEIDKVTKIVEFEGGEFWVIDGVLASGANGLTLCPDGKFYFLANGQIQRVSQTAEYDGEFFMVKNGELDPVNGLYEYNGSGSKFAYAAGRLRTDINGLWQNPVDGLWYFLANGQLQNVSQVAEYNGQFFVIKNGMLDADYNGTIEYDSKTFNVVNGQLYDTAA